MESLEKIIECYNVNQANEKTKLGYKLFSTFILNNNQIVYIMILEYNLKPCFYSGAFLLPKN